jgi:hypothetical protein
VSSPSAFLSEKVLLFASAPLVAAASRAASACRRSVPGALALAAAFVAAQSIVMQSFGDYLW